MIKLHEKVWIPQDHHPDINFVGLLIGPRGNTLKALERDVRGQVFFIVFGYRVLHGKPQNFTV